MCSSKTASHTLVPSSGGTVDWSSFRLPGHQPEKSQPGQQSKPAGGGEGWEEERVSGPSEGTRVTLWPPCALVMLKRQGPKNLIITAALSGRQG